MLKALLRKLTKQEKAELEWYRKMSGPFGPGHFYSPIPDLDIVRHNAAKIWPDSAEELPGIDINADEQLELLMQLKDYYPTATFTPEKRSENRYFYENTAYSYSDALILYCMLRHLNPKNIIEVGSGYSSCVLLDTNEKFFGGKIKIKHIEPYPELLLQLLNGFEGEPDLSVSRLQDVDVDEFRKLKRGDILLIDSTHVSKIDSDVNYLFSVILPALDNGVYIHIHDIFYPFEYPQNWVYEGRFWNEAYMLRAFLQYNSAFKIVLFSDYMHRFHAEAFSKYMPLCLKDKGSCLWLEKL